MFEPKRENPPQPVALPTPAPTTTTPTIPTIPTNNKEWIVPAGLKGYPYGITSDAEHIFSSDYRSKSIQKYTHKGQFLQTWPIPSASTSSSSASTSSSSSSTSTSTTEWAPGGIESVQDHLYIIHHKTLMVLDKPKNQVQHVWNLPEEGKDGGLYLKVDESKEGVLIYFTLESWHQIFCFTPEGKEVKRFGTGTYSDKKGEFHFPRGLEVDDQRLYVCDRHNHRIQALNKTSGAYELSEGKYGTKDKGEFYYPSGILLYEGHLYVTDSLRVHILKASDLSFDGYLGKGTPQRGTEDGEFSYPKGLCAVDGTIYVSDNWNHRIQWFRVR